MQNTPDFFKVSRKEIFYFILSSFRLSWPLWTASAIGALLLLAGALYDVRIFALGLIMILAIVPTIGFFIYFSHILDTQMLANLLPHTVEAHGGDYLVRVYREETRQDEEGNQTSEWIEAGRMTLFSSRVKKCSYRNNFKVLFFEDSPLKVLYVPNHVTPEPVSCPLA